MGRLLQYAAFDFYQLRARTAQVLALKASLVPNGSLGLKIAKQPEQVIDGKEKPLNRVIEKGREGYDQPPIFYFHVCPKYTE